MEVASRPYAAAGIALVAASVIAVSPIAPPLPDVHLPNPAQVARSVELAAATTSVDLGQVLQQAVSNAQALLDTIRANPTPILSQIVRNQATTLQSLMTGLQTTGGAISTALTTTVPPLLQAAFNDLESGNVEGAINNVANATVATAFPITGFIPTLSAAITQPMTDLVNAINAVQVGGVLSPLSLAVTGILGPVLSGAGAFGVAVDNVANAMATGNPQAVLNAVVNGPAVMLDGVLNGGYGPDLSALAGLAGVTVVAGGLLSGGLNITSNDPLTVQLPGTINSLQALAQAFAAALTPPKVMAALKSSTLAAPAALPAAAAKTVTLKTGSTASIPAEASTPDAPATDGKATATSTHKPDTTKDTADTTKDSSSTSASAPASSSDAAESGSTTKDSTPKAGPTDTTTGNKSEPGNTAGSDASKSDDASNSTASHETSSGHTGTTRSTSDGAAKGASKGAHTESHGRHAK